MEPFEKTEAELQRQLIQLCDKNGVEINPQVSAVIFHKLGLLYRSKRHCKISLLRSAALLNAALMRQPNNQTFQDDLQDFCKNALKCAKAHNPSANLIEFSHIAAKQVVAMRIWASKRLEQIEKITENKSESEKLACEKEYVYQIKNLQSKITTDYKYLMTCISDQCIEIMGQPPCKYALVGMGSLAREEVSPYSDFEHVLVLDNFSKDKNQQDKERAKEYFRWYSVIFHVIVINLQETDLYSMCIPCLNDSSKPNGNWFCDLFTPQGISFDGMMPHACHFPLGKTEETPKQPWTTELIKPIDEMVQFLEVKDIKEGYKLGDLLTKTCFISGDKTVYHQFCDKVTSVLQENKDQQLSAVIAQLVEDLEKFNVIPKLDFFIYDKEVNIKQMLYRSITLSISTMGRLHNLNKNSDFEIINEFQRLELISDFAAHKLLVAVSVACHVRLHQYNSKEKQADSIYKAGDEEGKKKLEEMTTVISKDTLLDCLLTIHLLQFILSDSVPPKLGSFDDYWHKLEGTCKLGMLIRLGLYHDVINNAKSFRALMRDFKDWKLLVSAIGHAYIKLEQYEDCLNFHKAIFTKRNIDDSNIKFNYLYSLFALGNYKVAAGESDALLKRDDLTYDVFLLTFGLNAESKLYLYEFQKVLCVVRVWLKEFDILDSRDDSYLFHRNRINLMYCATYALLGLKHDKQSLHLALEARNFMDMIGNDALQFYNFCIHAISFYQHPPETLVCDLSERPTPTQTRCFLSMYGKNIMFNNLSEKIPQFNPNYTTSLANLTRGLIVDALVPDGIVYQSSEPVADASLSTQS